MERHIWFDRLGMFLTGGASNVSQAESLGGVPSTIEYKELIAKMVLPIPGLQLLKVFSENGEGTASLLVDGNGDLVYTPPDGLPGDPVSIAVGETKVVGGQDSTKAIVVKRFTRTLAFAGLCTLTLTRKVNGVLSMENLTDAERTAGRTTYRCIILSNLGDTDDLNDLSLWVENDGVQATYSLGVEELDSNGEVQSIVDETTAPSGVVFQNVMGVLNALDISVIEAGESIALWIKKEFPASGTVASRELVELQIFVAETGLGESADSSMGNDFSRSLLEYYRVADSSYDRYELYVGEDALPDFDDSAQPVATNATLPFTYALTPPPPSGSTVFYCVVRKRNKYNLLSHNQWCQTFEIESDGTEILGPLSAPGNPKALPAPGSEVIACASYIAPDRYQANRWMVWAKEGSDPVPGVDVELVDQEFKSGGGSQFLQVNLGSFTPGSIVHILVGVERDEDSELTTADVILHTIPAVAEVSEEDSSAW